MSCYIVSDSHLSALVRYACTQNLNVYSASGRVYAPGEEQQAVTLLGAANTRAYTERYGAGRTADGVAYLPAAPLPSHMEVIKLASCFDYQASDWSQYPGSDAERFIRYVERHAVRQLPGYKEAAWEI
jgi:hypothetical protein